MTSELTPLRGALLGLIAHRPMSGYDLAKVFDDTLANAWSAKHSQIYPELAAMTEAGLLSARDAGTRRRKEYRITARGRRELERWLVETPVEPRIARNEAVLRSFFLGFMPAAAAKAFLAGERRRHEERLDRLLARGREPDSPESGWTGMIALEGGLRYERMMIDWLVWAEREVDRRARRRTRGAAARRPRPVRA